MAKINWEGDRKFRIPQAMREPISAPAPLKPWDPTYVARRSGPVKRLRRAVFETLGLKPPRGR